MTLFPEDSDAAGSALPAQGTAISMDTTHGFSAFQDKYLFLMRSLTLKVAENLDCTVLLFGSRAHGTHRRSSDIDIGFSGLDERTFLRTRDRLLSELEESIIPHRVDIVNMDTAEPNFKNVAMKEAIIWKRSSRAN